MRSLRIHFTMLDLARTRVAGESDPLWEVVLSGFRLNYRYLDNEHLFGAWKRTVLTDPDRAAPARAGARLLSVLAPKGPYFPDFLTPTGTGGGFEAGLEAIRETPRRRLRAEMTKLAQESPVPARFLPVAEGRPEALGSLAAVLRCYRDAVITPHDGAVRSVVSADAARRTRVLAERGVEGLFETLPWARWRPPVLEVEYGVDRDLHLNGRGLVLVPSFFCDRQPITLADPDLPPTLIHPVDKTAGWEGLVAETRGGLAALMGPTRAAVLLEIAGGDGLTTTQVARRLSTSAAAVSRHAAVLRSAGLVDTRRDGQHVLHTPTLLGLGLLETPVVR